MWLGMRIAEGRECKRAMMLNHGWGVSIVSVRTVVQERVGAVDWYADSRQRVEFRGRLRCCIVGDFVVVVIHDLNNCLRTVSMVT